MKPFWDKKWGKDSICGITLTRLRPGKDSEGRNHVYTISNCGHMFYRKALIEWIANDNETCPTCRGKTW